MATPRIKGAEDYRNITESLHSMYPFYKDAAASTRAYELEKLFWQLGADRLHSAKKLAPIARMLNPGENCKHSSFIDSHRVYVSDLVKKVPNKELTYLEHIEKMERKILYDIDKISAYRLPLACHEAMHECRAQTREILHQLMSIREELRQTQSVRKHLRTEYAIADAS